MAPRSVIKMKIKLEHFDESMNRLMIETVRIRPALWDHNRQKIPGIKKTQQRQQSEVATTLNCSVDLFKKKWKNLKKCFYNQVKKIELSDDQKYLAHPNTLITDWPYYQMMLFLIDPNDIHPSVQKGARKIKKRPIEENGAGSSGLQSTESSSSNAVEIKKQRTEESDAVLPFVVDENIDLKLSQVSSTSNINYLSTGVIENDEPNLSNSQNDAHNQYEPDRIEVTPDIAPLVHPGVMYIMIGLNQFINTLTDNEKIHVSGFLQTIAYNIVNGIQDNRGN